MNNAVIVSTARTPIGDALGSLASQSAVELGTVAVKAALQRAGVVPEEVHGVTAGMVYKAGAKGNPARQVQLAAGIPVEASAFTVDQQCASSMLACMLAADFIRSEQADIMAVCGMESMSNVPYLLLDGRKGLRLGDAALVDGMLRDALHDAFMGQHMGITAENLAAQYNISRQEQDELALLSHQRAVAAIDAGKFTEEIVPVTVKSKKGDTIVTSDEHPRRDVTLQSLTKLRPAFKQDGTVTAGNASGINDGASAVILMSEKAAAKQGVKPLGRIAACVSFGVKPEIMGISPAYAIPKALDKAGLGMKDIGYFEINEAFAAQFLAVNRVLEIPMDRVNANGSGISLGHPVGSSGLRIIVSLLHELRKRGDRYGIASLCAGGGPGMATVIEAL